MCRLVLCEEDRRSLISVHHKVSRLTLKIIITSTVSTVRTVRTVVFFLVGLVTQRPSHDVIVSFNDLHHTFTVHDFINSLQYLSCTVQYK
jgi:hypothetical protein